MVKTQIQLKGRESIAQMRTPDLALGQFTGIKGAVLFSGYGTG